ncbi:MAG: arginine--tRNA ligase [Planctomycetes bacterium]|nr:arginine--tRNA ligase [Planctomycetota bacterium]
MKLAIDILEERISDVMASVAGREGCAAIVRPTTDAKFGDYQVNGIMSLAKELKTNPRKLAEQVVEKLDLSDICDKPEIAGPGFINLRLKTEYLTARLLEVNADAVRLGIEEISKPETVVVDFSGPNIAKQMHVGHLRSTIIGDCICRTLEFLGHKVIRQNHIGDWGTQFGMLIANIERRSHQALQGKTIGVIPVHLAEFEDFYREAKQLFDTDENFAERSRAAVVGLHSGDQAWIGRWRALVTQSEKHYQYLYQCLGVKLIHDDIRGESFYKDKLADIVKALQKDGLAEESDGAICVFSEGFKNKEGERLPLIVQKSDGAYLYATTDLAAIRYRVGELKADRIIYVTDARQSLHFEMVFAVARKAGWAKDNIDLVHVTFGSVLGENGKPLKTRSGENVKLKELLDEAVQRANAVVKEKNPELSEEEKEIIAKAVGIGAVKYADYSNNRTSDYVFNFDRMLAMDGNTAPYMQYAYARIKSIERKSESKDVNIETELAGVKELNLSEPAEVDLAKCLIRYGEAIEAAASDYRPNYLTSYLYELAQKFSVFYTNCPVLKAESDKRPTRLLLCDLTRRTIKHGLSKLLGIEVVEQM